MSWIMSLDIGQTTDYTALSVIDYTLRPRAFVIRHLQRFQLGTAYPDIVKRTVEIREALAKPLLCIDATGVGQAVLDMFYAEGIIPLAITITGGDVAKSKAQAEEELKKKEGAFYIPSLRERLTWTVPKRDLVAAMNVAFQQRQVKISGTLADSKTLIDEMLNFRLKISNKGHDSYEAWREGTHDDLVLSVALPIWWVSRLGQPSKGEKPSMMVQPPQGIPEIVESQRDRWGRRTGQTGNIPGIGG
jgi:hypothetical protein